MRFIALIYLVHALSAASLGMLKFKIATAERPSPEKAHRGGEDANFSSQTCIAVADGVGGWNNQGIDPSLYSRRLMKEISRALAVDSNKYLKDPRQLAVIAASRNDQTGTSTLVIVTLDNEKKVMRSANIGDSGYMILRKNAARTYELIFRSEEQQHSFNFPFQIGTRGDDPAGAEVQSHEVLPGDVVIVGSDGLFDNLYNDNILKIVNDVYAKAGANLQSLANTLLEETYKLSLDKTFMSPFAKHAQESKLYFRGGKSDDITIVIGEVAVEDNEFEESSSL